MHRNTSKAALYESIMRRVSRVVKNALNESSNHENGERLFERDADVDIDILDNLNTSHFTSMRGMFYDNRQMNNPVDNFDTSNVTDMSYMFFNTPFNQPLDNFDTSNVTDMKCMFEGATSFNQDLSSFDVSHVLNVRYMFKNTSMSRQNLKKFADNLIEHARYLKEEGARDFCDDEKINNYLLYNMETEVLDKKVVSSLKLGSTVYYGTVDNLALQMSTLGYIRDEDTFTVNHIDFSNGEYHISIINEFGSAIKLPGITSDYTSANSIHDVYSAEYVYAFDYYSLKVIIKKTLIQRIEFAKQMLDKIG